jgi:multidrug resistance protein MdtO
MPVSIADRVSQLIGLLAPQPGRVAAAARLAAICALTVLVVEIYQTPEPALTAYVVFFLVHEDRTTSISMSLVFMVVITVTIGIIFVAAMLVADDPMWRVIGMTVISFCLLFLASASKLRPIAATVALIVGYGLDELGRVQMGELATRGFLYVWLFVGIPAGVTIATSPLLAPPPRRLAERAIARRLTLAAAMLCGPDARTRQRLVECLKEGLARIQGWIHLAQVEKSSPANDLAALGQAADSALVLLSAIDVADRSQVQLPAPLCEYIANTLDEMARIVLAGRYPVDITWQAPSEEPLLAPLTEQIVAEIRGAIVHFAAAPNKATPPEEKEEAHGFFEKDAFTNPEHVHYAVKTTGAAMFCYVLYSLLDWPGIHTCFITCYIVSLSTTAESAEKLTLRILGALVGAAVGIGALVFVVPSLTSIQALMALVFIGAFGGAYVSVGSPRISYAGFQFAFAFFLCAVQGSAPAFDMTTARDRLIGIILGNLVSYVVLTNLWPVSVTRRIDPAIAALLRSLGAMMRAANPWTRRALASKARSALSAIETDIDLADYEPRAERPGRAWLEFRSGAARKIGALESPLLMSAEQDDETSAHFARRLEALAGRFAGEELCSASLGETPPAGWRKVPLFHTVDAGLRGLERMSD